MSDTVIKVENLSKLYRLGVWGTGTLKDDLKKNFSKWTGRQDPTVMVGSSNQLDTIDEQEVWALKDINFEVKQGEVLGIIGKNGAGKSTLLKILSEITAPTTGAVKIKGRVASLLEVGTGMHPELTGRENIFLNGAILGMRKWEIKARFDEIVDFAGIAKYIDTPIKRYSSGMRVRLGFAIAAFLEPEILIVDEVLAVGDAEFQSKAIGKMQEVSKGQGRTVVFVSHNMSSIKSLCDRLLLLSKGSVAKSGPVLDIISQYLIAGIEFTNSGRIDYAIKEEVKQKVQVRWWQIENSNREVTVRNLQSQSMAVRINFVLHRLVKNLRFNVLFESTSGEAAFCTSSHYVTKHLVERGAYELVCEVDKNLLADRIYNVFLGVDCPGSHTILKFKDSPAIRVEIIGENSHGSKFKEEWPGIVSPKLNWKIINESA